jgi:hypothetical protein
LRLSLPEPEVVGGVEGERGNQERRLITGDAQRALGSPNNPLCSPSLSQDLFVGVKAEEAAYV